MHLTISWVDESHLDMIWWCGGGNDDNEISLSLFWVFKVEKPHGLSELSVWDPGLPGFVMKKLLDSWSFIKIYKIKYWRYFGHFY